MHERLPVNQLPLNQLAKRFLSLEHQSPDPDALYVLQLAQWGCQQGKALHRANQQVRSDLLQSLDNLGTWTPQQAHEYLTVNPDDPNSPLLTPRLLRRALSARRAARVVLNALDLRLTADQNLDYPPTKYRAQSR